jgi:diphthine synthase
LPSLTFIGLGLCDEKSIALQGLEIARRSDIVLAELYTSYLPELNLSKLSALLDKDVKVLKRADLEENAAEKILRLALKKDVSLFVPGDPMVATTHISLRLQAEKMGIRTRVVNSSSIISAVSGVTGLQIYKFGRIVTIPFSELHPLPRSIFMFIEDNERIGLHTLALLDIDAEKERYMTIKEAVKKLLSDEQKTKCKAIYKEKLAIGLSRVGSNRMRVKAGTLMSLYEYDFESPPHSIIFPSKLHFLEVEALQVLCRANKKDLEGYF